MKKLRGTLLSLAALTSLAAGAQTTFSTTVPERERVTLWAGLSTEFIVLPGLHLGLSGPIAQAGATSVSLRGTLDTIGVPGLDAFLPVVGADLLLSRPVGPVTIYGGPGVATLLGAVWGVGGTVGVRDRFGAGRVGWFGEARARYIVGSGTSDLASGIVVSPGLRAGVTYRF
ncbi:hypothetical protein V3W47_07435 [Deinococcus sp. YIM 134068]|uniref:hypothetical protein n=1 Tax=Deinococcus lichenicola TaxID=3118910 RepID=UPI002F93B0B6